MIPGIGSWLTKRAVLTPHKEAIVDGARRFTYGALNGRVNRLAKVLQGLGLKSGDRLSILSLNCAEYVETIMAAAKLGLMLVPLNWRLTSTELAFILKDSGAETLLFHPDLTDAAESLKAESGVRELLVFGSDEKGAARACEPLLNARTDAEPVPDTPPGPGYAPYHHVHRRYHRPTQRGRLDPGARFWNAVNLTVAMGFTASDRNLAVLPMFHIGGIGLFTLPMLYMGGTVIIQRTFEPAQTLELLETENITLFFGVAAIFLCSSFSIPDFKREAFEKVRVVMSGGAPLPVSLVRQYADQGIILQQGFGMSEAAPSIATLEKGSGRSKGRFHRQGIDAR